MKKITKKQIERMDELYETAINYYLNKTDFDALDYLDEKEKREYQKLHFLEDSLCCICGNPEVMYKCPNCDSAYEEKIMCECKQQVGKKKSFKVKLDKSYHKNC